MRVIALRNRLNIILTLLCIRIYNRSIVEQSSVGHVTVVEGGREGGRERGREGGRDGGREGDGDGDGDRE